MKNSKFFNALAAFLLAFVVSMLVPTLTEGADNANTWYKNPSTGVWYYYDNNGEYLTGLQFIDFDWYYFDDSGKMQVNTWKKFTDGWMYFKQNGAAAYYEVVKIGNDYYGFDENCHMLADTFFTFKYQYRFGADGKAVKGWYKYQFGTKETSYFWYFFGSDCKGVDGWFMNNGKWYYAQSGKIYGGHVITIDDYRYCFDKDGAMITGWNKEVSGGKVYWYYFLPDGRGMNGWFKSNDKWYYAYSGSVWTNRYSTIDGAIYRFDENGAMVTGWYTDKIYDKTTVYNSETEKYDEIKYEVTPNYYYYEKDGKAANGWKTLNGKTYYFKDGKANSNGVYSVNNVKYVFNTDGSLSTGGWTLKENVSYNKDLMQTETEYLWNYAEKNGMGYDGWLTYSGKTYYFNEGKMVYGTLSRTINDVKYAFDDDGVLINGWAKVNKNDVYCVNGKTYTGWVKTGGNWYYVNDSQMYKNKNYEIDYKTYKFNENGQLITNSFCERIWSTGTENTYVRSSWDYAGDDGAFITGWKWINGRWYYFREDNYDAYSDCYRYINGTRYFFNYNCEWVNDGWCEFRKYSVSKVDGQYVRNISKTYYYLIKGEPVSGKIAEINGSLYCFDKDGIMLTDCTDYYTYFGSDYVIAQIGSNGVVTSFVPVNSEGADQNDSRYYYDSKGEYVTGLKYINGDYYYFDDNGCMIHDSWHQNSDGTWMYFKHNGVAAYNELIKYGNDYYGFYTWYMVTDGCYHFNRYLYCFGADGKAVKGWYLLKSEYDEEYDTWYYFGNDYRGVDGWISSNGKWYYAVSGKVFKNCISKIEGYYYRFDKDCKMVTGWYNEENNNQITWYYYLPDGHAKTGWFMNNGKWYYASNGKVYSNIGVLINDEHYMFDENGAMVTGWYIEEYDSAYIYNNETQKYEWIKYIGTPDYYYYEINGKGINGWKTFNGKTYYFKNGRAYSNGVYSINNVNYVFNIDGSLSTGGWTLNKTVRYKQDLMQTETEYSWNYAEKNGTGYNGWLTYSGKTYYIDSGEMIKGQRSYEIGNENYSFDDNGVLADGWVKIGNNYTYCVNGRTYTGWIKSGNNWYYFKNSSMYKNGSYIIDYNGYAFDENGVLITDGWYEKKIYETYTNSSTGKKVQLYKESKWYYADADGVLVTGWKQINGKWYFFNEENYAAYTYGLYKIKNRDFCFNYNGEWVNKGWCEYRNYSAEEADGTCVLKINKKYNYVVNGSPVKRQMIEINGSLYCFNEYGIMLTDMTDYSTYYGSDRVRAQIGSDGVVTSWKKI